ncbi:DUF4158 domain-containing protein [Kitasatospora cineracea]|uniref:DUF4158 domain-containing protein n=1 Tax=Kitasatospora cineracea TaxID=88074 RepID=UPI00341400FA
MLSIFEGAVVAVEFLTDEQASRYGAFYGAPARAELERFFFLDDADREKVQAKRRAHNRLGFAVQLTTVRFLGRFMPDPRQVLVEVAEYLAEQLGVADVSVLAEYGERDGTARSHAGEIQQDGGWRDFAEVRDELVVWLDARAWTTGEGPKALFEAAVGWLRERRVLLPGVSRFARLVASVREVANQWLWETPHGLLTPGQRAALDELLTVPTGARVSELDRLRRGPARSSPPRCRWCWRRLRRRWTPPLGRSPCRRWPRWRRCGRWWCRGASWPRRWRRWSSWRRRWTRMRTRRGGGCWCPGFPRCGCS